MTASRWVLPVDDFMSAGVRGWSYLERQDDGQIHPGADLNIGAGDADRGMEVRAFGSGVVEARASWDGVTYGFGNVVGVRHTLPGEIALWGVYAHCDGVAVREGDQVEAGQPLGLLDKSGGQTWAHLHFETRWRGFGGDMPVGFWGGLLPAAEISRRYADPFSLFRLAPAWNALVGELGAGPAVDVGAVLADRDYNFALKMVFEHELRGLEARRRLRRGRVDQLISSLAR